MTTINIGKEGQFVIDQDTNINMDGHQEDGAAWNPTIADMFVEGGFTSTILPGDTVNYLWNSIGWEWEYFSGDSDPSAEILVQLVGIKQDLNESQPLYEYQVIPTYPFNVSETKTIQLNDSGSNPNLIIQDASAGTGKIRINLPNRWSNYLNAVLSRPWLDGYTKRKPIPITGTTSTYSIRFPASITVTYDSDMNADFSDLRFTDSDGVSELDYYIIKKTDSTSAIVRVELIEIEPNNVEYIYCYYGNSTATSESDGRNLFTYFDDFEDGLYTGRDIDYKNWTSNGGTPSIINSGQISGTYSLKHIGTGSDTTNNSLTTSLTTLPYITGFDFKLATQGSATNTPLIWLWFLRKTSTAFIVLWTSYNSGTNKQLLSVSKYESSTWTDLASANWLTGKMPVNGQYNFKIIDTGSNISIYVNDVVFLNFAYTTSQGMSNIGFGANKDSAGIWDNMWYYIPEEGLKISPSVGTIGAEESTETITYDTVSNEDQQYVTFTTPSDWTLSQPAYLTLTDLDNTELRTHEAKIKPTNTVNMTPHCPTGFYALRLKFNIKGTDEMGVNISSVNGSYEYLEDLK